MGDLSKNFSTKELDCNHCGMIVIDPRLVSGLQRLRDSLGIPVRITSGYRCPEHNEVIGGVKNSYHTQGKACDLTADISLRRLYFEVVGIPEFGGIGLYSDCHFIHVDVRDGFARWGQVKGRYCSVTKALDALKIK